MAKLEPKDPLSAVEELKNEFHGSLNISLDEDQTQCQGELIIDEQTYYATEVASISL